MQEAKQITVPLFRKRKYLWEANGAFGRTQFNMQHLVQQGFPSKAQGSWILLGKEGSLRILGSCEPYCKNGCGFMIETGFSWNCPSFKTESPMCQESSQFQANWDLVTLKSLDNILGFLSGFVLPQPSSSHS